MRAGRSCGAAPSGWELFPTSWLVTVEGFDVLTMRTAFRVLVGNDLTAVLTVIVRLVALFKLVKETTMSGEVVLHGNATRVCCNADSECHRKGNQFLSFRLSLHRSTAFFSKIEKIGKEGSLFRSGQRKVSSGHWFMVGFKSSD